MVVYHPVWQVIAYMTLGIDVSPLFSEMVMVRYPWAARNTCLPEEVWEARSKHAEPSRMGCSMVLMGATLVEIERS